MGNKPALHARREVASFNRYLDFKIGASSYQAVMDTGWYEDQWLLCAELQAEMRSVVPPPYDTTVTVTPIFLSDGYRGHVRIYLGAAGELLWSTGGMAAANCGSLFGFDNSADDTGASAYISDLTDPNSWFSRYGVGYGTVMRDSPEVVGGKMRRTLSGKYSKQVVAGVSRSARKIEIIMQPAAYTFEEAATGTDENRSFEQTWKLVRGNENQMQCRWFNDQEDDSSYGTYYLREPSSWVDQIKRQVEDGSEYYQWTVELDRKES